MPDKESESPSARPLRVCHVVAAAAGATWMVEQLRDLRDRHGCEVAAVVSAPEGALVEGLRAEGIPWHVKGHRDFLRAIPLVLAEFPETKFILVGSGWWARRRSGPS